MIAGDLETFPLPDLLQWIDAARVAGTLYTLHEGREGWLRFEERRIVGVSASEGGLSLLHVVNPDDPRARGLRLDEADLAHEQILDLFSLKGGSFRFVRKARTEAGVEVDLGLRELLFEALRHHDEAAGLMARYPDEGSRLIATGSAPTTFLSSPCAKLLRAAQQQLSIGEARVAMGLSRAALLRRLHELVRLDLVKVEGTPSGRDPLGRLAQQAVALSRAHQFDEALHVLKALKEADPTDRRAHNLSVEVRRRQLVALYSEIPPRAVPLLLGDGEGDRLSRRELGVVKKIDGRSSVTELVLSSPISETDTLKTLRRLLHLGLAELELRGDPAS